LLTQGFSNPESRVLNSVAIGIKRAPGKIPGLLRFWGQLVFAAYRRAERIIGGFEAVGQNVGAQGLRAPLQLDATQSWSSLQESRFAE
jgi:hypothetical protein